MEDLHLSCYTHPHIPRTVRYQGAIVRDGAVLLICQREHATGRTYWLLPGGRMEPGETPEATVAREMQEETNLTVRVERLLFEVAAETRFAHDMEHTYLCTPIGGEAAPGYEPEPLYARAYSFIGVRWVALADEAAWGSEILDNAITRRNLQLLQRALGYRQ
jgi:8-oxo-dGTP diphosphatase